ncbi:Protein odr-4-like protein [Morus notabilis]|uniref:Protein odr-4-like protein n=1 Tax=Morus notabilis TaxID=981085 RepID=W9SDF9_9ROSA|nr:protein odr-4 homolog [Morus notabilis]EXC01166.1 Protein odr-4-like protein [Morus notabilis]
MVKAVVGEESHLKLAEDRLAQSAIPAQVGLVIGKLSSNLDRGFVFDLVPTPVNDAGVPACSLLEPSKDDKKKGSKSKSQATDSSSLVVDNDWVAEHARQVSRMLLGGMKVVGIYVWVGDSAFKNSTIMLCQTVKAVADAASLSDTDLDERILIHICYSPRRWTCRNCSLASNITSSNLRPCDFKMGKVLNSLQTFKCMYNFDLRLPIYKNASNVRTLTDVLRHVISIHAKELKSAKAVIDGNLVVNDEPCTSDGLHEVELLLPFMKNASTEGNQKEVTGVIAFSGSVCSYAYLNSKEPISQAVAQIKEDIILSLQSRLDIICDEADGDTGPSDAEIKEASDGMSTENPVSQLSIHLLRKTCNVSFPRRVFIPWLAGMLVCDYLQSSETLEVLKDHCKELLSMETTLDSLTILEPEVEAPTLIARSFWDVAAPLGPASSSSSNSSSPLETHRGETGAKTIKSANVNILLAAFFLLLSVIVGFVLLQSKHHNS